MVKTPGSSSFRKGQHFIAALNWRTLVSPRWCRSGAARRNTSKRKSQATEHKNCTLRVSSRSLCSSASKLINLIYNIYLIYFNIILINR